LLLLDEPTNHLDIASREALEEALEEFPGTILAISHDRYFINRLAKRVWELREGGIASYIGNYDEYKEKCGERPSQENNQRYDAKKESNQTAQRERQSAKKADGSSAIRANERKAEQLELEIAALEAELAREDETLHHLGGTGDTVQLQEIWSKREETQAKLDALLELWMELEQ
jgi:ATPase subunit of ABC transporter with duplicated ATPase domains